MVCEVLNVHHVVCEVLTVHHVVCDCAVSTHRAPRGLCGAVLTMHHMVCDGTVLTVHHVVCAVQYSLRITWSATVTLRCAVLTVHHVVCDCDCAVRCAVLTMHHVVCDCDYAVRCAVLTVHHVVGGDRARVVAVAAAVRQRAHAHHVGGVRLEVGHLRHAVRPDLQALPLLHVVELARAVVHAVPLDARVRPAWLVPRHRHRRRRLALDAHVGRRRRHCNTRPGGGDGG